MGIFILRPCFTSSAYQALCIYFVFPFDILESPFYPMGLLQWRVVKPSSMELELRVMQNNMKSQPATCRKEVRGNE